MQRLCLRNPPFAHCTAMEMCGNQFSLEMQRSIKNITFHKGILNRDDLMEIRRYSRDNFICVLDDLLHDLANNVWAQKLICLSSHHLNATICVLGHNIFEKGKVMRTLSLNIHHFVLFENRRDSEQLLRFGRQVFPHKAKYFLDVFQKAVASSRHLFIDLNPCSNKFYSLRTRIFPGEDTIILRPKNEYKTDDNQPTVSELSSGH